MPQQESSYPDRSSESKTPVVSSFSPFAAERIPPQAIEIERAVLGALLQNANLAIDLEVQLRPDHFYEPRHKEIYEAISFLVHTERQIDVITVSNRLKESEKLEQVGGVAYLMTIVNTVASDAHILTHIKILIQKYLQRQLIELGARMQRDGFDNDTDVEDHVEAAINEIFYLQEYSIRKDIQPVHSVMQDTLLRVEDAMQLPPDSLMGIASGFRHIDEATLGWQKGTLVIVAARPAMGKTSFVLNMAKNMAQKGINVAFFTLEMNCSELALRLLSAEIRYPSGMIQAGKLTEEQFDMLKEKSKEIAALPIYMDDTAGITVPEIRSKCRRLKAKGQLDIVIIDYLQLVEPSENNRNANREQEVSRISRRLKGMAKELEVPVIALSQLSRASETRGGRDGEKDRAKRPRLSDLRESGAIEQDADIVGFIHRPEYYKIVEYPCGEPTRGKAEFIIEKFRNGSPKTIFLGFEGSFTLFLDLPEQVDYYDPETVVAIDNEDFFSAQSTSNTAGGIYHSKANDLSAVESGPLILTPSNDSSALKVGDKTNSLFSSPPPPPAPPKKDDDLPF